MKLVKVLPLFIAFLSIAAIMSTFVKEDTEQNQQDYMDIRYTQEETEMKNVHQPDPYPTNETGVAMVTPEEVLFRVIDKLGFFMPIIFGVMMVHLFIMLSRGFRLR